MGLDSWEQKENNAPSESRGDGTMDPDKRSAWLRKLDEECQYQVVMPRRQLVEEYEIMKFLDHYRQVRHVTPAADVERPARLWGLHPKSDP